jgi:hypothetical protein
MITRDQIKAEIDKVEEEHLPALYQVVKALEGPRDPAGQDKAEWNDFIASTYGSTAEAPIERGEQGGYEAREPFE